MTFQSTLPVWGGTLLASITRREGKNFNPPSPCGEGRNEAITQGQNYVFQSTLPVWGGTFAYWVLYTGLRHFNPPSPCGEGPLS